MAVNSRVLFNSGERLDVPDFLSGASYVGADFKYLLNGIVGTVTPYIVKGFDVIDPASSIGSNAISIRVAESSVFCPSNSTGAFFHGLEEGNADAEPLVPVLRKNATNYVYLTITTENRARDLRTFWDPDANGGVGAEFTQDVNTQQALKIEVNVSTSTFPNNTLPICKVVYGASVISTIQDCRNLFFRLSSGGPTPNLENVFSFRELPSSAYARNEPTAIMSSSSSPNAFQGGDKNIRSLKEWMDVVMTRIIEISGATKWYSDASRDSVKLIYGPLVSLTDNFEWDGVDQLTWESLAVAFDNSDVYFNTITDDTATLDTDGQALYVDIDRTDDATPLVAVVGDLLSIGSPAIAGSRFIIAWRVDGEIYTRDRAYEVGRVSAVATASTDGVVRLNVASYVPLHPVVPTVDVGGLTVAAGLTRGAVGAGTLTVGTGANDTAVTVSKTGATTTIPGSLAVSQGVVVTQSVVGGTGITSTGNGVGYGVRGTGGASDGVGGYFSGGGTLGWGLYGLGAGASLGAPATTKGGVYGLGFAAGEGVRGVGGATSGAIGVRGVGGSTNGIGVYAEGIGSGVGLYGVSPTGIGIDGLGGGINSGIRGTGGVTNATGVEGIGGGTSGKGVTGTGAGSGSGVLGTGGATNGVGVKGQGVGTGAGIVGLGLGAASAASAGNGVHGVGAAGVEGIYGKGGSGNAAGVWGDGTGTGAGLVGVGGGGVAPVTLWGAGVHGVGKPGLEGVYGVGGTNAPGVYGDGMGTGAGVVGVGGATGAGGVFTGGVTSGRGVYGTGKGAFEGVRGDGGDTAGVGVTGNGGTGGVGGAFTGNGAAAGATGVGGATGTGVIGSAGGSPTANTNSRFAFEAAAGHVKLSGGNPDVVTGFSNVVTPTNILKSSGVVECSFGVGVVISSTLGFNAASAAGSGNRIRVSYPAAGQMEASGDYSVFLQPQIALVNAVTLCYLVIAARNTAYFEIEARKISDNSVVAISGAGDALDGVHFIVVGENA